MIEYTLRQLEVFTAATEQESLTRAADQLHLTQSTASTHLRSLEQCLGTTLLLRRGQGGVTLTEDGQRLYPLAKKILAQCQALADAAGDPRRLASLPLLLGASTVPGQYMLPALMAAFCRKHPQYRCELRHGDSAQIHRLLQNGQIRMGFVGSRMDTAGMAYHPLLRDELVMVTPNTPHYQAAHRRAPGGWSYWASRPSPESRAPAPIGRCCSIWPAWAIAPASCVSWPVWRTPRPLNAWWFRAPAYRCCRLYP